MAQQNLLTRSGNRIIITLDGFQVGLLQSVRASDDYSFEPASGIGDIHTVENVPSRAGHSLSVSAMTLNSGSLRALGLAAENGDDVLQGRVFDIVFQDKDTGATLRKYVGCSYTGGDVEVSKHAIVVTNAQFMALDVVGTSI